MLCKDCIHNDACLSWIKHGLTLYSDYEYSTENCPHFQAGAHPDYFQEIVCRLRDYSDGYIWSDGSEILCRTESAANALADMLECLYEERGETVLANTGYYDPEEDKRNNEEDRNTGWWYVNLG